MEMYEKTLESETLFEGRVFTVKRDKVELADGSRAMRELVVHNGGAGILPIDKNGSVTLVKQYRYGAGEPLLEICAGKLEKGEKPSECAVRELAEELGLRAKGITDLGVLIPTPAYDSERIYIYMTEDPTECDTDLDEGELVEAVKMPLAEAVLLVLNGKITDAKTQIALLKAERLYGKD